MATVSTKKVGGRPRRCTPSTWGRKVEMLAAKKSLTRSALADRLGITYPSMWALIMGKSKPSMETFCKLADILGVPLDKLRQ
jgi:transcriptional regulator with XRE-family HTH domain